MIEMKHNSIANTSNESGNKYNSKTRKQNKKKNHSTGITNNYGMFASLWLVLWTTVNEFMIGLLRRRRKQQVPPAVIITNDQDLKNNRDLGSQHLCIVGLDCEMVGVGYKGRTNMLARCTLVMWNQNKSSNATGMACDEQQPVITVIYDKLVKPTQQVMDYRTEFSGIIREMLLEHQHQHHPAAGLVDFQTCRAQVRNLFSSIDGQNVMVVGHALINDFDVLQLSHPSTLIRDTATYPPFLRKDGAHNRRQQKLSHLAKQELGLDIQHNRASSDGTTGHCSVEDASAALMLYLKHQQSWEKSLGKPLLRYDPNYDNTALSPNHQNSSSQSLTFFLDGCNLPISLQKTASASGTASYRIISRKKVHTQNAITKTEHDWIPTFRTWLLSSSLRIERFVVMFDGSKYQNSTKIAIGSTTMVAGSFNIEVQITDISKSADDCLVDACHRFQQHQDTTTATAATATVTDVLQLLLMQSNDKRDDDDVINNRNTNKYYVVVRRKGGGRDRQTKLLFQKLNLTRSNGSEGACCLTCLTKTLWLDSVRLVKEMQRLHVSALDFEIRDMSNVRMAVCTDDILLADRIVNTGGIVLTYRQFQLLKIIS